MGGGGGSDSYATQLPPWARQAHQRLIAEGESLAYGSQRDFPRYVDSEGNAIDRIAGFSPYEQSAFGAAQEMFDRGDPAAGQAGAMLGEAAGAARGIGPISSGYQARSYDTPMYGTEFDFGNVESTYDPRSFDFGQYGGPRYGSRDFDFGEVDSTYEGRDYDFGRFTDVDESGQAAYEKYMSPYMDAVVGQQKRSAADEYERQKNEMDAASVQSGARGGYREALQGIMGDAIQAQTMSDITAQGRQRAYEDAANRFEADRAAAIQAARMGDATAVQEAQMRMQASDANRNAAIQAAQMADSSAAREAQMGMDFFGQDRAAAIQAAQMGDQSALAAARMGMEAGAGNRAAAVQAAQMGMDAFNQNRDALYRAQQAGDQSAIQEAQMDMQAAQNNVQNALAQSEAFRGIAGAGMDIGTTAQKNLMQRIGMMEEIGRSQRGMDQAEMDLAYQEFMREQDYPWMNLGRLGQLVAGVPSGMEQRVQSPGMSIPGQLLGLGVGASALKNLMGSGAA